MKINRAIVLQIPRVPNFIICAEPRTDEKFSIADFTDEELESIGKQWTEDLLARAK